MDTSPTAGLLIALLSGAPERRHILTVHSSPRKTTGIERGLTFLAVQHPWVVEHLQQLLTGGGEAAVLLRSYPDEISPELIDPTPIPVKCGRGWMVRGGAFHALTAARLGERLRPEPGMRVTDAWEVDLAAFWALTKGFDGVA